jgi:hypothetical protein
VRDRRTLLAGIVLLAIVVRLAGMGDRLSEDEGFSWLVASAPDADTFLDRLAAYENTPPLFYLLLTPLPLDDEHWLRLPSLVASVASVPVLYLAVRPLLGTAGALLSALGLAVAPYAVNWSNFSRGFMLANLGLLIALWAVVRLAGGGSRRWWWVYGAGAVGAIYSEYDAVLFLAALIAAFAWVAPARTREVLVLGALPVLALVPWLGEFARSLDALDETKAVPIYPSPGPASLRDSVVPLLTGEHGAGESAALRSAQFALIAAGLAAAVWMLATRGKRDALRLLGATALGTLLLHAAATLLGPEIFAQRYLTSLIPRAVALLAGAVALAPWRHAVPVTAVLLLALGGVVFAVRHGRELEPDMAPVEALIAGSGERTVLTNSARVAFYLRDMDVRLDRPLGFGVNTEDGCDARCPPFAIVDDSRPPAGVREGPGETHVFGPLHVRLREAQQRPPPVRLNGGVDPLTCSLAVLVSAALGGGGEGRALPVTVQDDALLLHPPAAQVQATARRMANLGADRVRLTAGWSALAPQPESKRMPRFDSRESNAYPREPWLKLDRAVRAVTNAGLEPQIDVAFFAPRWAVTRVSPIRGQSRHRWEPDAKRFGRFAEAVARRYNGRHRDPTRPSRRLPAVRLWTTWNEPNHAGFLLPQWRRVGGEWVPHSPHLYRRLHERSYAAIKAVNPENRVLMGALAAEGKDGPGLRNGMAPMHFLRELACVDRRGRHLRRPECRDFKPLRADGFSQHPYSLYSAPDVPSRERDFVRMGDLGRLSTLLTGLHRAGRIASQLPIYVTEYGYETNPPDVVRGVPLGSQARYHGQATFLAWRQPDVAMFAQFLLQDIAPPRNAANAVEASRDWHSGLYFHDGRPKPAVQAFKLPFWAESRSVAGHDVVVLFGQVRPNAGRKRAEVQMRGADGVWRPIRALETRPAADASCGDSDTTEFLTDHEGFYLRVAPYEGPAAYRVRWIKADGRSEYGIPITVGTPDPLSTSF